MDKHDTTPLKNLNLLNPWHLIAVGFGSGLIPKAPGTFGSLAAIPLCVALIFGEARERQERCRQLHQRRGEVEHLRNSLQCIGSNHQVVFSRYYSP